jgi:hypothetical protein
VGAVHSINSAAFHQREVVAHVRFSSDCRHDDAQQRNDARCHSRYTQRSKIHALETLDALLCGRAIPMQRRASNDIGASRGARERVRESKQRLPL